MGLLVVLLSEFSGVRWAGGGSAKLSMRPLQKSYFMWSNYGFGLVGLTADVSVAANKAQAKD